MEHTFMLEQELQNFVCLTPLESTETLDQLVGNELMVFHSHLDRREDSEMVFGQELDKIWV